MATASSISIKEALELLDGPHADVAAAVADGAYAFWLGSGISRERVIDLDGVLSKLLEFIRGRITADLNCQYRSALQRVVDLANPSDEERLQIDHARPVREWACLPALLRRLWRQYAAVLSERIPNEAVDYLLWVGLDFPNTFAAETADAEHLAIGMLALEGVVTQLASANWDGLLEAAMRELGYGNTFYRITVTGDDLRNGAAAATLYKFHGCALRAIEEEAKYRPLLVARSVQINGWGTNPAFKIVRDQLGALVQRSRTMMIGMSAQDVDIKQLFAAMNQQQGWKWSDQPPSIVFSAQELGDDQLELLNHIYGEGEFEKHADEIREAARIQAYAKPLLLALLLNTLSAKLEMMANDVSAPHLDEAAKAAIAQGIKALRDRVAEAGNDDRIGLARSIAANLARARHQLQNGTSEAGIPVYFPIDNQPVSLMRGKLALVSSGQREAAVALGLIGLDEAEAAWVTSVDDPTICQTGALRLTSANASARVFLAANDDKITSLIECGAFEESDDDVVVICSSRVADRQQRSPSGEWRNGTIGPRFVALGPMLRDTSGIDDLRDQFRGEVGL